ncbi:hypothetical protein [Kribbella catacumbae]|uniref:hypothetical protein n=1 Tax=Kribbella catacumbae TaxID=460086 RepID=UPI00037C99D9|nr:hypothetical protein [Kribbella catacumbae]
MRTKLTDHQIIEAIERIFVTEHGDAAAVRKVRQLLAPPAANDGLPTYDFETATEAERWAYDQGYEAGWESRLDPTEMDWSDVEDALKAYIEFINLELAEVEGK